MFSGRNWTVRRGEKTLNRRSRASTGVPPSMLMRLLAIVFVEGQAQGLDADARDDAKRAMARGHSRVGASHSKTSRRGR
jgi:hypothetical protein